MITKFNIFENYFDDFQRFFGSFYIGDYVKCIDDNTNVKEIKLNNIYEVEDIKTCDMLTNIKIIGYWWSSSRFVLATPEEIEEHKLKKDTNKYNL